MYIHEDGSVTGSVNQDVLDRYTKAKAEGGDLSEFDPYLAVNSPEAKLAQGAPVSLPGTQEPSADAKAADERAAAQAKATQETSDQRAADLAAQLSQNAPGGQQAATEREPEGDGYDRLTKAELQEELGQRGLPTSGNKDELAQRLRDHDAGVTDQEV